MPETIGEDLGYEAHDAVIFPLTPIAASLGDSADGTDFTFPFTADMMIRAAPCRHAPKARVAGRFAIAGAPRQLFYFILQPERAALPRRAIIGVMLLCRRLPGFIANVISPPLRWAL